MWRLGQNIIQVESDAEETARQRLLPMSEPDNSFCGKASKLVFEESETKADWVVAQTRLGQQSITIIPVEVLIDGLWKCGDDLVIDPSKSIDHDTQLAMLRQGIKLSYPDIIHILINQPHSAVFNASAI